MPKRPRQHLIEEASIAAFRAALPLAWLYRPEPQDYGIDGSVEIVDSEGNVTGKRFLVQLKGTDEPRLERALRVRLREDTYRYYRSLDIPVLLVRYHAHSHRLFVRWTSELDPYYARRTKSGLVFTLDENVDGWTSNSSAKVETELEDWRWIRAPVLSGPLILRLELRGSQIRGASSLAIARDLDNLSRPIRHLVQIGEVPVGRVRGRVVVTASEFLVFLPGGNSSGLHAPPPARKQARARVDEAVAENLESHDNRNSQTIAADILVAISFALHAANHDKEAAELAVVAALKSSVLQLPEAAVVLATIMGRANRHGWLAHAAASLALLGWPTWLTQLLLGPVLVTSRNEQSNHTDIVAALETWVRTAEENEEADSAAIAHYNVGRYLGLKGKDYPGAVRHFHRAAQLHPIYRSREYFWADFGAIFADAGRLHWAASAYRQALVLGGSDDLRGLLADALWRSGRYAEAEVVLRDLSEDHPEEFPQRLLLKRVIGDVKRAAGMPIQLRDSNSAGSFVNAANEAIERDDKLQLWKAALRADALCVPAWFNLALSAAQNGRHAEARIGFIVCGLIDADDMEAWANALAAGHAIVGETSTDDDILLYALTLLTAARRDRNEIYREIVSRFQSDDPHIRAEIAERVRTLVAAAPTRSSPLIVRLHADDGTVKEIRADDEYTS